VDRLERRWRKIDQAAGTGEVDIGDIVPRLSRERMLAMLRDLLESVGYEMLPPNSAGSAVPDFYGRRLEGAREHNVAGVLCMSPEEASGAYDRLVELQKVMGDGTDYAVAAHQMPEYLLYDVLEANRGKLYIDMKERMYMMWICYATDEGEGVWCFLGGSSDRVLEMRFTSVRQLTAEAIVGPRVTDMLMEDEKEEF